MSRISSRDPAAVRLTARLSRSDLLWVANTAHGPGGHWHARVRPDEPDHDHLSAAEVAIRYLVDHGVPVPEEPLDENALTELRIVRGVIERLLVPGLDPWTDESRALLEEARYTLAEEGRIRVAEAGCRGFCRDLLLPLLGLVEGSGALRRCANPACRLLFEDGSRNHGRLWCDTTGCGNRDRVRMARASLVSAPHPDSQATARHSSATTTPGGLGP